MKKIIPINDSDGCSRTIVSGYWKMFTSNLLRIRGGRDKMTGIMEIYDNFSKDTAGDEKGIH